MIWQQPWAWVGMLVIAAPILIHLLGLGRSPRQRFPTLRFFDVTRLAPTRRTQLHDPWLLLLRVAVLAAAVAALAQPLYRSAGRERDYAASLARVIVLDTSASVMRGGQLDAARRRASELVTSADAAVLVETARPSLALDGALAWLDRQPQRRELVVVSDFQLGSVDSVALLAVPADVGMRLERIPGWGVQFPIVTEHHVGSQAVRAITTRTDSGATRSTQITWTFRALADAREAPTVRVLAGDTERGAVGASLDASFTVGARLMSVQDSGIVGNDTLVRTVVIVTPDSPQRVALLASARAPREPWMLRAVAALKSDVVLQEASRYDTGARDSATGLVVAYTADDRPSVWAAESDIEGRAALILTMNTDVQGLTLPALLAAARAVGEPTLDHPELEPATLDAAVLTRFAREPDLQLRRQPNAGLPNALEGESDGRWLWGLVLLLLGAEALLRQRLHTRRTDAVAA